MHRFVVPPAGLLVCLLIACGPPPPTQVQGNLAPEASILVLPDRRNAANINPGDHAVFTTYLEDLLLAGGNPVVSIDPLQREAFVNDTDVQPTAGNGYRVRSSRGRQLGEPGGPYDYVLEYGFNYGPTVGRIRNIRLRLVEQASGQVVAVASHPHSRGFQQQTRRLLGQLIDEWRSAPRSDQ